MIKFVIILFLTSCSTYFPEKKMEYSTVSFTKEHLDSNDISISEMKDVDGETIDENEKDKKEQSDLSKYTIVFGPGLYLSAAYLPILRKLEKRQQRILILSGHGMSAYIAAMFAFGFKPDYIEWKFYTFLEEIREEKIYSKSWLNKVEEILFKDLVGKKIEDSTINLILPFYDVERKKVIWKESGDVTSALIANLTIFPNLARSVVAYPWEYFNPYYFRNLGKSKFVSINISQKIPMLKRPNDYFTGLFTRGSSQIEKSIKAFNEAYIVNVDKFYMDVPNKEISESSLVIDLAEKIDTEIFEENNKKDIEDKRDDVSGEEENE